MFLSEWVLWGCQISFLVWTQKILFKKKKSTPSAHFLLKCWLSYLKLVEWLWNLKYFTGRRGKPQIHTGHCDSGLTGSNFLAVVCTPSWLQGLSKLRGWGWLHGPGILKSQGSQYTVASLRIFGCENHSQLPRPIWGSRCTAAESIKIQQLNRPGSATKPGCWVATEFPRCLSMESRSEWRKASAQPGMRWHPSGCLLL